MESFLRIITRVQSNSFQLSENSFFLRRTWQKRPCSVISCVNNHVSRAVAVTRLVWWLRMIFAISLIFAIRHFSVQIRNEVYGLATWEIVSLSLPKTYNNWGSHSLDRISDSNFLIFSSYVYYGNQSQNSPNDILHLPSSRYKRFVKCKRLWSPHT